MVYHFVRESRIIVNVCMDVCVVADARPTGGFFFSPSPLLFARFPGVHPWCVRITASLQADLEDEAAGLVGKGDLEGARSMLAHHTNDTAIAAVSSYHTLFDTLVARYHDGYQMQVG